MISYPARRRRSHVFGRPMAAFAASTVVLLAGLHTALAFHDEPSGDGSPGLPLPLLDASDPVGHLLISEVMTGGISASDEFIELYNPQPEPMPLEGLEVVYVTATGGTVTRKATWSAGSFPLAAGAHILIANSAGAYLSLADQTYTGGLAATGGSVAIRIEGAATAIDAVGWGNASSTWVEGTPAPAVAVGHAMERVPGGSAGSGQDTNDNSADFADRATPDPQNSVSAPISIPTPAATGSPSSAGTPTASQSATQTVEPSVSPTVSATPQPSTPAPTPMPTPLPTPTASPTPAPTTAPMTIAQARGLPDGASVVIEGLALTDSTFADGGGYVADATGGIAVLLSDGAFLRGALLRVTGVLDDRFSQRTVRADATGIAVLGTAAEPAAEALATGGISEAVEGQLVEIDGTLTSGATELTTGLAFDVDDGSGPIRVLVASATGIDTTTWARGARIHTRGVVGQRDSSGTGTAGYRVQPRDAADVLSVAMPTPVPTPTAASSATPGGSSSPNPSASPSDNPDVLSIAAARARPVNARVTVRGVVTLPTGLVDEGTAVIQDSSGAIMLRLGDEAGSLRLGELVEVAGTRSTKAGMETIRVVAPPLRLGTQPPPDPRRRDTGALSEQDEAMLVVVRAAVTVTPRRTSADNVYFDVDDGSGPIRVFGHAGAEVETESLISGTVVQVVGVLGQETTGRLPDRGYRLWPRRPQDLEVVSQPAGTTTGGGSVAGGSGTAASGAGAGAAGVPGGEPGATAGSSGATPQQGRPRLRLPSLARASASAAPEAASATAGKDVDPPAEPVAASLLFLGGLLLVGSGVATGDPSLPGMLLSRLRDWIGGGEAAPDPALDPASERAGGDPQTKTALPRLVPLAVADEPIGSPTRAPRGVREERERILPPT